MLLSSTTRKGESRIVSQLSWWRYGVPWRGGGHATSVENWAVCVNGMAVKYDKSGGTGAAWTDTAERYRQEKMNSQIKKS